MEKINYNDLNSKQKENYNYHKVAAALADYGYDSMRLNNDWQGADFIAGFISSFFRNNQSNIPILLVCNYNLMIINRSLN